MTVVPGEHTAANSYRWDLLKGPASLIQLIHTVGFKTNRWLLISSDLSCESVVGPPLVQTLVAPLAPSLEQQFYEMCSESSHKRRGNENEIVS